MCGSGNCDVSTPAGNSSDSVFVSVSRLIGFSGIAVAHTAADILSVAVSILLLFRQYRMLVKRWKSRAEINAWSYGKSWGSYDNIPQRLYKTGYSYKSQAVLRFH